MRLQLLFFIWVLFIFAFNFPGESKKKTDNCLPKDAAKKTDWKKLMPTLTTTRNKSHRRQKPLKGWPDYDSYEAKK